MNLSPAYIIAIIVGAVAYFGAVSMIDRSLEGQQRTAFRYAAGVATLGLFFYGIGRLVTDHARGVDITKAMIAITAAGCVFYEQHRAGMRRPISERWKRFVGVA